MQKVQAKYGDTVRVHYTASVKDGPTFDSSEERGPLEFTLGDRRIIPGFERAVLGMSPGETKTESIGPEDAFGVRRSEMVFEVERTEFPEELDPEVGMPLQMVQPNGARTTVIVVAVNDDRIVVDANHPLAGLDLVFEITLVEIV
jgi:peptidylprolyl isomerase